MPRKIRQLKSELRKAGFYERTDLGKGSHTRWFHPAVPEVTVTISGADGEDARDYQESAVRRAVWSVQRAVGEEAKDG
jgi:predicted RNA binding protein YcfA (HicA-like mRNA interferase family)